MVITSKFAQVSVLTAPCICVLVCDPKKKKEAFSLKPDLTKEKAGRFVSDLSVDGRTKEEDMLL